VDDQPDVLVHADRAEVPIPGFFELVEPHSRAGRADLQVEGRGFDGLLLPARQLGQAVGKSISNAKFHSFSLIKTTNRLCTSTNMAAFFSQRRRRT